MNPVTGQLRTRYKLSSLSSAVTTAGLHVLLCPVPVPLVVARQDSEELRAVAAQSPVGPPPTTATVTAPFTAAVGDDRSAGTSALDDLPAIISARCARCNAAIAEPPLSAVLTGATRLSDVTLSFVDASTGACASLAPPAVSRGCAQYPVGSALR